MATARPAEFPDLATDATYTSGPKAGQATKVPMDTALIQQGHIPFIAPDAQKFNWWGDKVATWLRYLDERLSKSDPLQLFDNDTNAGVAPDDKSFKINAAAASAASATKLLVDDDNFDGDNIADLFQASQGAVVHIFNADRSIRHQYLAYAYTDQAGYTELDVTHIRGTGTFVAGDAYYLTVDAIGAAGGAGDLFEVAATATLGTAAAQSVTYEAVSVPGVLAGDVVVAVDSDSLSAPTSFLQCRVTGNGTITIPLCNPDGSGQAIGELDLRFVIYRPGTSLRRYSVATVSFGTVAADSTSYVNATVPGVQVGDVVVAIDHDINAPSGTGQCRVTATDTVQIPVVNPSASSDIIGDKAVVFTVVRPGVAGFLLKSASISYGNIGANSAPHAPYSLADVQASDSVCNVSSDLSATNLCPADARIDSDNVLGFGLVNPTSSAIGPGTVATTVLLWRPWAASVGGTAYPGGEAFRWRFTQSVVESDPGTKNAKVDNVSIPAAEWLYISREDLDGLNLSDWFNTLTGGADRVFSWLEGDRTFFAIFDIVSIEDRATYFALRLSLVASRPAPWQYDEGATVVFSFSRGGTGGGSTTGALRGIGALAGQRWDRIHFRYDASDGSGVDTVPVTVERTVSYLPLLREWHMVAFRELSAGAESGNGQGQISYFVPGIEGGVTGLTAGFYKPEAQQNDYQLPDGWTELGQVYSSSESEAEKLKRKGPVVLRPVKDTTSGDQESILVGCSRTDSSANGKLFWRLSSSFVWLMIPLNRTDDVGPADICWTGLNYIICYNGPLNPNFETCDPSVSIGTWTNRTAPTTNGRWKLVSNADGVVLAFGINEDYDISTDHGLTWAGESFPDFGSLTISGATYWRGKWVVMLSDKSILTSADGVSWVGPTNSTFEHLRFGGANSKPLPRRGLTTCGDLLACVFWTDAGSAANTSGFQDVFFCDNDDFLWKRSGGFGRGLLSDPDVRNRRRTQLRSTSESVVDTPDVHQLMLVSEEGAPGGTAGGLFAEGYLSKADHDRSGAGSSSSASSSGSSVAGRALIVQTFEASLSMTAPPQNTFRYDSNDPTTTTQIALDDDNIDGESVRRHLLETPGKLLARVHNDNFSVDHLFRVAGMKTGNSGWVLWDVAPVGTQKGTIVDGQNYAIELDALEGEEYPAYEQKDIAATDGTPYSDFFEVSLDVKDLWGLPDNCVAVVEVTWLALKVAGDTDNKFDTISAKYIGHIHYNNGALISVAGVADTEGEFDTGPQPLAGSVVSAYEDAPADYGQIAGVQAGAGGNVVFFLTNTLTDTSEADSADLSVRVIKVKEHSLWTTP